VTEYPSLPFSFLLTFIKIIVANRDFLKGLLFPTLSSRMGCIAWPELTAILYKELYSKHDSK
jgi:hypothetical protein